MNSPKRQPEKKYDTSPVYNQNLYMLAAIQQQLNLAANYRLPTLNNTEVLQNSTPEKRSRTVFSMNQLEELEKVFQTQQYIVGSDRTLLAARLRLTEAQVKVWFQNRRIKNRKNTHQKIAPEIASLLSKPVESPKNLSYYNQYQALQNISPVSAGSFKEEATSSSSGVRCDDDDEDEEVDVEL